MVNEATPPRWIPAVLCAVAALAFARTLGGGFLGDDFVYLARFLDLPFRDWPRLFTREWSEGIWGFPLKELRPFAALSFMAESRLWGGHALGYRLFNLGLFIISACFVARLAWRYSRHDRFAALAAGLLFVLSPVQAEPVAWITGRVDLLAVCAALAFWFFAERHLDTGRPAPLCAAGAALLVGVFSKELCLLAAPLFALSWAFLPRGTAVPARRRWRVVAVALAVIAAYAACRHAAFGGAAATPNSNWHDAGAWQRQASYLGWLFPVLPFQHRLTFAAAPGLPLLQGLAVATGLLAVAVCGWARWSGRSRLAAIGFFGGLWWLATILSLLVVAYFSPRHLHFGSAGLALAAGLALGALRPGVPRWALGGAAALWLGLAQSAALDDWAGAGRLSREAHARIRFALELDISPPVVVFSLPPQWRTAWLWSWSSPHFAKPPFMSYSELNPGAYGSAPNYYRPDSWAQDVAAAVPSAVRARGWLHALHLGSDGRFTSRDLRDGAAVDAAAELERLLAGGIDEPKWTSWVRQLAKP
jgi:hypothetical protein